HILYSECRCSRRIVEHLLGSDRPAGVAEHVLLVGEDGGIAGRLRARGFRVTLVNHDELATRYHVAAVPLLVVFAESGELRYAGGYTTRKQGPDPRDVEIIRRAAAHGFVEALPVFGCAVAQELKRRLDPTGLL